MRLLPKEIKKMPLALVGTEQNSITEHSSLLASKLVFFFDSKSDLLTMSTDSSWGFLWVTWKMIEKEARNSNAYDHQSGNHVTVRVVFTFADLTFMAVLCLCFPPKGYEHGFRIWSLNHGWNLFSHTFLSTSFTCQRTQGFPGTTKETTGLAYWEVPRQ